MADVASLATPGVDSADLLATKTPIKLSAKTEAQAKAKAQDFEAMFLNSMFQHMFTGLNGDGPLGGQGATGVWRSMLTDQFARTIAKSGGIGIADQVYRSLIAHQEARA